MGRMKRSLRKTVRPSDRAKGVGRAALPTLSEE
jgi:hypothetical protein